MWFNGDIGRRNWLVSLLEAKGLINWIISTKIVSKVVFSHYLFIKPHSFCLLELTISVGKNPGSCFKKTRAHLQVWRRDHITKWNPCIIITVFPIGTISNLQENWTIIQKSQIIQLWNSDFTRFKIRWWLQLYWYILFVTTVIFPVRVSQEILKNWTWILK